MDISADIQTLIRKVGIRQFLMDAGTALYDLAAAEEHNRKPERADLCARQARCIVGLRSRPCFMAESPKVSYGKRK